VTIQFAELPQNSVQIAASIAGIRDIEVGGNKLIYTAEDPEQQNPRLIRRLVEAGAAVQFVGEQKVSLEDVYMQLIGEASDQDEASG
jgi:ABC-2 type transport system ATP-binding protein